MRSQAADSALARQGAVDPATIELQAALLNRTSQQERHQLRLGGQLLEYTLKRSARRKSIGMRVDRHGLTVAAPLRASLSSIHDILGQHAEWILAKLATRPTPPSAEDLSDGTVVRLLGEPLQLVLLPAAKVRISLQQPELWLSMPHPHEREHIAQALERWLRQQARSHFLSRMQALAPLMQVQPSKMLLSGARTRWGSCNSKGEIRLNWRLVQAPGHLIDYVIIHELAHLHEMNHSPRFWAHVAKLYPDYRAARAELRHNGGDYHLI